MAFCRRGVADTYFVGIGVGPGAEPPAAVAAVQELISNWPTPPEFGEARS
jgi:hypothetical protein